MMIIMIMNCFCVISDLVTPRNRIRDYRQEASSSWLSNMFNPFMHVVKWPNIMHERVKAETDPTRLKQEFVALPLQSRKR